MERCPVCHEGTLRRRTVERTRHVDGYAFTAKLPALLCDKCGEMIFEGEDLGRFDRRVALILAQAGITHREVLRFLRKSLGLQAKELAALLGVRPETISRWELGKGKIDRPAYAVLRQLVFDQEPEQTLMADNLQSLLKPRRLPKATQIKLPKAG